MVKILRAISESQKAAGKSHYTLAERVENKHSLLWTIREPRIAAMENTLTKLVKQKQKTRKLLMTIFFTGIVPLLAFITALVLKLWILT